jgi:hypothetical protein
MVSSLLAATGLSGRFIWMGNARYEEDNNILVMVHSLVVEVNFSFWRFGEIFIHFGGF